MRRMLITPPAIEPVSLAEAKMWLRLDGADEDDIVASLIAAARLAVESWTRRRLIAQTWRLVADAWPATSSMKLPLAPFRALAGLRTYDAAGTASPVPPASYAIDATPEAARLVFLAAPPTPGRVWNGVEIDVVAGYGEQATDVPAPLRQAIRMLVARWHEARGDAESDAARPPQEIAALIAPWRRGRLA